MISERMLTQVSPATQNYYHEVHEGHEGDIDSSSKLPALRALRGETTFSPAYCGVVTCNARRPMVRFNLKQNPFFMVFDLIVFRMHNWFVMNELQSLRSTNSAYFSGTESAES
jgi:hypothetical protein